MKLIPPWAQIAIAIAGIAVIFGAGWTVNGWRLSKENQKLKFELQKSESREDAWRETAERCQENRGTLEEELHGINEAFASIAQSRDRLQWAIDNARKNAIDRAAAEDELAKLEAEHQVLADRVVSMTACQTYEAVLVSLAGGDVQ
jgi:chromosome segregation ATPase